jgi:hypothetical protein
MAAGTEAMMEYKVKGNERAKRLAAQQRRRKYVVNGRGVVEAQVTILTRIAREKAVAK